MNKCIMVEGYHGEEDCANYNSYRIEERECCGGKKLRRIRVNCRLLTFAYSENCNRSSCSHYVRNKK